MPRLDRVRAVELLGGYHVRLTFGDESTKIIDLEPYLHGPIFEAIRSDTTMFRTVHFDQQAGTIVWDNGADIDPDVLYYGRIPAWMQEQDEDRRSAQA